MSFNYDPYRHIEVLHTPGGDYKLYCHSCGGEFGDFVSATPVAVLFHHMALHVQESHRRNRTFFLDWSRV